MESNNALRILGATYGPLVVTDVVRQKIANNSLTIQATNQTFGDTWPGIVKTLVIVYQYGNFRPETLITQEGTTGIILPTCDNQELWDEASHSDFRIYGAAYGLAKVTKQIQKLSQMKEIKLTASNNFFGDGFPGIQKSFMCVWSGKDGVYDTLVVKENFPILFQDIPFLIIFKAIYGLKDVTQKIGQILNDQGGKQLNFTANNTTFACDSWPGIQKSFVMVYSYSGYTPRMIIIKELEMISINFSAYMNNVQTTTHKKVLLSYDDEEGGMGFFDDGPDSPASYEEIKSPVKQETVKGNLGLQIVGAAYGLKDVTQKCRELIKDNGLIVEASNSVFGDSWYGVNKSLVVIYQFDDHLFQSRIAREGCSLYITPNVTSIQSEIQSLIKNQVAHGELIAFHPNDTEYLLVPTIIKEKLLKELYEKSSKSYNLKTPNVDSNDLAMMMKAEMSKLEYEEMNVSRYCFGLAYAEEDTGKKASCFFIDSEKKLNFFDPVKGVLDESFMDHYTFVFII